MPTTESIASHAASLRPFVCSSTAEGLDAAPVHVAGALDIASSPREEREQVERRTVVPRSDAPTAAPRYRWLLIAMALAATAVLGSAAPTAAQAAQAVERPAHAAPAVRRIHVFVRDDRAVLVVARMGYSTRSKLARTDTGRVTVSLTRKGRVVTRTDDNRLQGVQSHGFPIEQRLFFSPRAARKLGLRGRSGETVLVSLTASQRGADRPFAQTRLRLRMSPVRTRRRTPRSAGATIAQQQQFHTADGWPPEEIYYGSSWNGVLFSVGWTNYNDDQRYSAYLPYIATFSSWIGDGFPSTYVCYVQPHYPVVDSLVDSEGNFEFNGNGWLDDSPCFADTTMTGKVSPAPLPPYGTVPCASASVTFTGWNFPDGSPEPLQALCECAGALSRPLTISCLSDPAD